MEKLLILDMDETLIRAIRDDEEEEGEREDQKE